MQNLTVNIQEKLAALRANSYFSSLSDKLLNSLAQGTNLRSYEAGEIICWQGDVCTALYIIKQGSVKLFKLSPKGRELIIRVFSEGATFNEVPIFDYDLNPVNVAALEECHLWTVDAEVIRSCIRQHPEMAQAVILNLTRNLRMLVGAVEELSFYQVTNRLARLLYRLPPGQLEDQHITQDQLAARLGTVREVVARSLRDLERSGAIRVERRQIRVIDANLLRDWAQEPYSEPQN
jgi:CRP/FNR family transcriptional regulator